jgi:hypothetical protein
MYKLYFATNRVQTGPKSFGTDVMEFALQSPTYAVAEVSGVTLSDADVGSIHGVSDISGGSFKRDGLNLDVAGGRHASVLPVLGSRPHGYRECHSGGASACRHAHLPTGHGGLRTMIAIPALSGQPIPRPLSEREVQGNPSRVSISNGDAVILLGTQTSRDEGGASRVSPITASGRFWTGSLLLLGGRPVS